MAKKKNSVKKSKPVRKNFSKVQKTIPKKIPDPVFAQIAPALYKQRKVDLLRAQLRFVECFKGIENIVNIQKEKYLIRAEINKTLKEISASHLNLVNALPVLSYSSSKRKSEDSNEKPMVSEKKPSPIVKPVLIVSNEDELDMELREIQEELGRLNAL